MYCHAIVFSGYADDGVIIFQIQAAVTDCDISEIRKVVKYIPLGPTNIIYFEMIF